jgi:hypothetical protein
MNIRRVALIDLNGVDVVLMNAEILRSVLSGEGGSADENFPLIF